MIGIDLTNKDRFKNNYENIAEKILHSSEKTLFLNINNEEEKINFIASRWAIKEALFKCDNKYKNFSNISVIKDLFGRYIFEDLNDKFEISTSNEDKYIIAIVKDK